jgi:hypothetical protein
MSTTEQEVIIQFMDDTLTKEQKDVIKIVYNKAKESVETLIGNMNMDNVIKISTTLAQIIKLLEKITLNGNKISGSSKKQVALELFRLLLNDLIKDENVKEGILAIFDVIGDEMIETMVDVSKTVNTSINQVIDEANGTAPIVENAPCCLNLIYILTKKKVSA